MGIEYRAAAPGQPGVEMTKEIAKAIADQENRNQKSIARRRQSERARAQRAASLGYGGNRPNHFFHDSLGDPATCTGDHNHPCHIGEKNP